MYFHATKSKIFNTFDREIAKNGFFFAPISRHNMLKKEFGNNISSYYLKYNNPIIITNPCLSSSKIFIAAVENKGHDAIIYNSNNTEENLDEICVFSPKQIKSAELNTYDENGDIIPIAKRFNDSILDIRY